MRLVLANTAILCLIILVGLVPVRSGLAQQTIFRYDTLHVATPVSSHIFKEAVDVSIDDLANLYVVDRGAHAIVKIPEDGSTPLVFGGPGSRGGQFYEPADLDPTTGFLFIVADAGNGRLQRLGTDFVYLESLATFGDAPGPIVRRSGDNARDLLDDIVPIAVSTTPDGSIYAIDGQGKRLLRWNKNRQLVGATNLLFEDASLAEPVDMATSSDKVYILDAGLNVITAYDYLGNRLGHFATGLVNPRSLVTVGKGIAVLDGQRLMVLSAAGETLGALILQVGLDVVDFELHRNRLFLLTNERLYVAELESSQR